MIYRFDRFTLDTDRIELRRGDELVEVEPQVFNLLVFLIENRQRVVGKDELIDHVWGGRIVSDATLSSRISSARRAVGDSGRGQGIIRTFARRGFRFVLDADEEAAAPPRPSDDLRYCEDRIGADGGDTGNHHERSTSQIVHFCTTRGGVRLAYATVGQGAPLVKAANWLNHLEYDWQSPVWRHVFEEFSKDHLLVRYDERGTGLSDWDVADISFEVFVRDLETVVDAVGLERFALLGISQGCAVSIAYAVRHPERVSHLVLYGGYARGRYRRGDSRDVEDALLTLMREGWGQDNPAFRQIFTSLFMPDGTVEQMQWFNELQKMTTSPENAFRLRRAMNEIDISELLAEVSTPTIVLHARNDAMVPFDEGRRMAAMIPGARFVALEGKNHLLLREEPAWRRFVEECRAFLRSDGART